MKSLIFLSLLISFNAISADFSRVDCNSIKMRKIMIEEINNILKNNDLGVSVLDAYDQKTVSATKDKVVCHGTYEFSDGDKLGGTYELYLNSVGSPVNTFEADDL